MGLQWGAFFGDVLHEVERVESGYRITLTYTLHRDTLPNPNTDMLLTRATSFHAQLQRALADPEWMPEGGAIGFHCRHLYEETSLAQAEAKLKAGGSSAYAAKLKLKNEDAVVTAVLAAVGLQVHCLRLLQMEYMEEDYVLEKMPTKKDASGFGCKRWIEDSFKAMTCTDGDIARYALGTVSHQLKKEVVWLGSHDPAKKKWVDRFYGEYFGNEASPADFYTAAAFVAIIPPFNQRSSINAAASQPLTPLQVNINASAAGPTSGKRKAKEDEDEDGDDAENDSDGEENGKRLRANPTAPPSLFPTPGPSAMTAAQRRHAALNTTRVIHVSGGRGGKAGDGNCTVSLPPGAGLKELKTFLRKKFGKASHSRMGSLMLADAEGNVTSTVAKSEDLIDGTKVHCTYQYASGNLGNLIGGGFGGRCAFRRGWFF